MQLEACLRSLKTNYKEYEQSKVTVVFKATEKEYLDGYRLLFGSYPEVSFVHETDFKSNLLNAINIQHRFTMFVMDDILYKNEFSVTNDSTFKIMASYGEQHVLAVSLRLHKGITYCYATDKSSRLPNFSRDIPNEACVWNFRGCDGDWGYPYSLDSNIYFTSHIKPFLEKLNFHNPNSLESVMNLSVNAMTPQYIIC
jgi:hypothetical protein